MPKSRARAAPVSCQFCRSKKLRCNRVQPCSSCTARGVDCVFVTPPSVAQYESTIDSTAVAELTRVNAELLERMQRLEAVLLPTHSNTILSDSSGQLLLTPSSADVGTASGPGEREVYLLDGLGTREDSLLLGLSRPLECEIATLDEILGDDSWSSNYTPTSCPTIVLPEFSVALSLLDNYIANVDHVCRILHIPSIRSLITTFYLRLDQHHDNTSPLPLGQAALLLSLFALSAFFYDSGAGTGRPPLADAESDATVRLCRFWSRAALDVLDASRRSTSGSLEDAQAYILMSYVAFHLDGFSARARSLTAAAASVARDIGLHRLDASGSSSKRETGRDRVAREVKRRVFWHITSTDWLQSTMTGPQEGTYTVHPNHIAVQPPRDCNDDDIALDDDEEGTSQLLVNPEQYPTSMSFFLARVRLAHLCRELTDTLPLNTPTPPTGEYNTLPSYDAIIALDTKLEAFIANLPFFFRNDDDNVDNEVTQRRLRLEAMFPNIPIMRYCILSAAHTRRCRLHQRFLLRCSSSSRFKYSRRACLDSARAVISMYRSRDDDDDDDNSSSRSSSLSPLATARMGMAVHHTHLALVIMVMDLCFNRNIADDYDVVRGQVAAAVDTLSKDRDASPLLGRSLDALRQILDKYGVHLDNEARGSEMATAQAHAASEVDLAPTLSLPNTDITLDGSFDTLWQMVAQETDDLDLTTWDNLFSSMDSRPF